MTNTAPTSAPTAEKKMRHINDDGVYALCRATTRPCPKGAHVYLTDEEYEEKAASGNPRFVAPKKRALPPRKPRTASVPAADDGVEKVKAEYAANEDRIVELLPVGAKVQWKGQEWTVRVSEKPRYGRGEGKTDAYIELFDGFDTKQLKISYKKPNADFIENKISAHRAEAMFGADWQERFKPTLDAMQPRLQERGFEQENGNITLGYRLDVVNKNHAGSARLDVSHKELVDLYAGSTLDPTKRHGTIGGATVENSGVANWMLVGADYKNGQDILDSLETVHEYVKRNPDLYLAPKAVNLRPVNPARPKLAESELKDWKFEAGRPLGFVWSPGGDGEAPRLSHENALQMTSSEYARKLTS